MGKNKSSKTANQSNIPHFLSGFSSLITVGLFSAAISGSAFGQSVAYPNSQYLLLPTTNGTNYTTQGDLVLPIPQDIYGATTFENLPRLINASSSAPSTPGTQFDRTQIILAQSPQPPEDNNNPAEADLLPILNNGRDRLSLENEPNPNGLENLDLEGLDLKAQPQLLGLEETENSISLQPNGLADPNAPVKIVDAPLTSETTLPPLPSPASTTSLINPEPVVILPPPPKPQEPSRYIEAPPEPAPVIQQAAPTPAPVYVETPVVKPPAVIVSTDYVTTPPPKKQPRQASSLNSYIVKRGDTLGLIAQKSNVSGRTLSQVVVAIYRANPAAFLNSNMHDLIVDKEIQFDVDSYPTNVDARRLIAEQYREYLSYKGLTKPAALTKSALSAARPQAVGTSVEATPSASSDVVPMQAVVSSTPVLETSIVPQVQVIEASAPQTETGSGKSLTIALIALLLAALGGYVYFRIRNKNRILVD